VKTVIILGKGYVGCKMSEELSKADSSLNVINISARVPQTDYTSRQVFDTILSEHTNGDPLIVINCSGPSEVKLADDIKYGLELPLMLDEVCASRAAKFIHLVDASIYRGHNTLFTETDKVTDAGEQTSFKEMIKCICENILSERGDAIILRTKNLFDDTRNKRNFIQQVLNGSYRETDTCEDNYTSLIDFSIFISRLLSRDAETDSGIYNVVNEGIMTPRTIIMLLRTAGYSHHDWHHGSARATKNSSILSTSKIKSMGLGLPSVSESLQDCINEIKNPTTANVP